MAKEKQEDTWGNVKASKFNQRSLERQRKKRMQELNTQNGALGEQVKNLQNQKLDFEDAIIHLIDSRKDVEEDLLVARAEVVNLKRSLRKIEKAELKVEPEVKPQVMIGYKPEEAFGAFVAADVGMDLETIDIDNIEDSGESESPDETTLTDSVDS